MSGLGLGSLLARSRARFERRVCGVTVLLVCGVLLGACPEDKAVPTAPAEDAAGPQGMITTQPRDGGGDAVTTSPVLTTPGETGPGGQGDAGEAEATPVEDQLPDGPIEWTTTIPLTVPPPRATSSVASRCFL